MKLNYQAITNIYGRFCFSATDNDEAHNLIIDYLREIQEKFAHVSSWDSEKKNYKHEFTIEIPEVPKQHSIEYRIDVNYFKYVEFSGMATEKAFADQTRILASVIQNTLPEHQGWERKFRIEPSDYTDDDRYHVKAEEIKL